MKEPNISNVKVEITERHEREGEHFHHLVQLVRALGWQPAGVTGLHV